MQNGKIRPPMASENGAFDKKVHVQARMDVTIRVKASLRWLMALGRIFGITEKNRETKSPIDIKNQQHFF